MQANNQKNQRVMLPEQAMYCKAQDSRVKHPNRTAPQVFTNGYFGGYVDKRQLAGRLERTRCIEMLFTLRAKTSGKGHGVQLQASSPQECSTDCRSGSLNGGSLVKLLQGLVRPFSWYAKLGPDSRRRKVMVRQCAAGACDHRATTWCRQV